MALVLQQVQTNIWAARYDGTNGAELVEQVGGLLASDDGLLLRFKAIWLRPGGIASQHAFMVPVDHWLVWQAAYPQLPSDVVVIGDYDNDDYLAMFSQTGGGVGPPGPEGPQGPQGDPGPPGQGVPAGGSAGQMLVKDSGTDYDTGWVDQPQGLVPAGGAAGQVLAKTDGTNYNTEWVDQSSGGGGTTSGYVWDGAAYVLDAAQSLFVGPSVPGAPQQGDIWFNTAAGTATVQGFSLATSLPATVTAGGVAHTKGSWTELVASTDTPMAEIILLVQASTNLSGAGLRGTLADIGIGALGAEVAVVSNLDIGRASAPQSYRIPLFVAAGSRISVRTQSLTPSLALPMQVAASTAPTFATYFGGDWVYAGAGSTATTWGTSTATSTPGVLATPGAINTWSAWTQMVASTAARMRYLMLLPNGPNAASWSVAPSALFDVGVGGAGAEQSLLDAGAFAFSWNTTEAVLRCPLVIGVDVPSGSRLSVRWQATDITQTATGSLIGIS